MLQLEAIGNLGADARVEEVNGQKAIYFNLAINRYFKDENGDKQKRTVWISCAIYRERSTSLSEYLKKGTQVFVSGPMTVKTYTDHQGIVRASVNMRVQNLELLSSLDKEKGESGDTDKTELQVKGLVVTETANNNDLPF